MMHSAQPYTSQFAASARDTAALVRSTSWEIVGRIRNIDRSTTRSKPVTYSITPI